MPDENAVVVKGFWSGLWLTMITLVTHPITVGVIIGGLLVAFGKVAITDIIAALQALWGKV
jgi:hypothetical protein